MADPDVRAEVERLLFMMANLRGHYKFGKTNELEDDYKSLSDRVHRLYEEHLGRRFRLPETVTWGRWFRQVIWSSRTDDMVAAGDLRALGWYDVEAVGSPIPTSLCQFCRTNMAGLWYQASAASNLFMFELEEDAVAAAIWLTPR